MTGRRDPDQPEGSDRVPVLGYLAAMLKPGGYGRDNRRRAAIGAVPLR